MKSKIFVWAVGLFFASVVCAIADGTNVVSSDELVQHVEMPVGGYTVVLFGPENVSGLDSLLDGILTDGSETAETISAKVDEQRVRLFPDLQIRLAVSLQPDSNDSSAFAGKDAKLSLAGRIILKKSIYWWNLSIGWNDYWMHCEQSSAASGFVQTLGGQNYIFSYNNNMWDLKADHTGQRTWAGSTHGYWQWRCFGAIGGHAVNKSHAVMYFYDLDLSY